MNTINYFPYDNRMNLEDALAAASAGQWQFDLLYQEQIESFKDKFLAFYAKNYDEFLDDDGISNMVEGGLTLKIEYEMMPKNQSCKVYAKIV